MQIHEALPVKLRLDVDLLIHDSWSAESELRGDVQLIVPRGEGTIDGLDAFSTHIIILDSRSKPCAYGRVSIARTKEQLLSHFCELYHHLSRLVGEDHLSRLVGEDHLSRLVGEDGVSRLVGEINLPIAYFNRLVVHPDHRGKGLSRMIHIARINISLMNFVTAIYSWAVGEIPAIHLKSLGFTSMGQSLGFETKWYKTTRSAHLVKLANENDSAMLKTRIVDEWHKH